MGSANLTEQEIQMRYPPSVLEWERKHGFARYERNGVLYVCAVKPIDEINESIRREREQYDARKRIAERRERNESSDNSERTADH